MKIYKLDPNPSRDGTGGNKVETMITETLNEVNDEAVVHITDQIMGVGKKKIEKLMSYWRHTKLICEADVVLTNTADRRACLFLHHLRRKNPKVIIVTTHYHYAYLMYKKFSRKRAFVHFYENNILKNSDIISVCGPYTYKTTKREFPNKEIMMTGVPIPRNIETLSCRSPGELLFIGTIEPRKGLHFLIEALGKVREKYHISIAGNYAKHMEYYNRLIARADQLGISDKIDFLGRITDEQKEKLLQKAYAFVFPTQDEGYGIVMIEAMGHGVPVIAFNNTSIPYTVVNNHNGLLVNNLDVNDLAKKISFVLNNPDEVGRMGENGVETYNNTMTVEQFKAGIRTMYDKIVNIREKGR